MDAFDARHFNVCRGAGPGDLGDQRGRRGQRSKYSGSVSTTWLARRMQRCQSGSSVITRRPSVGGVMQHDGSRVGDAAEGRGHHAFALFDLGMFVRP